MFQYSNERSNNKTSSYAPAKTLEKGFRILELLGEKQPMRVPDITAVLELNRANVHRLLATLERLGYVEKTEDQRVRLSYQLFKLGNTVPHSRKLDEVAKPAMNEIAELADETVNLGVHHRHQVIYLDKVECRHSLRLDHQIGETDPLYCTALGKVLLSAFSAPELSEYLESGGRTARTRHTRTGAQEIRDELELTRSRGYAMDLKELDENLHCLAAPVYNHGCAVVAAISISGPAMRFTREKMETLTAPLIESAAKVSRDMGCLDETLLSRGLSRAGRRGAGR